MTRAILMVLLLTNTALAGCTDLEEDGCDFEVFGETFEGAEMSDGSCFPMNGGEFARMISDAHRFDGYAIASEHNGLFSLRAEDTTIVDGIEVVNTWMVEKNDTLGLRYVAHRLEIGGTIVVDYQIYDGLTDIYVSYTSGSHVQRGRDMNPVYEDPFVEISRLAMQDPGGVWPSFTYDFSQFAGLEWVVTGDAGSLTQVGRTLHERAPGDVEEVYVQTLGFPPSIQAIESYSDTLSDELYRMTWDNETGMNLGRYELFQNGMMENMLFDEGMLDGPTFDRAPVPFIVIPEIMLMEWGMTGVTGSVPEAMIHEVNLSEIEMHVFSGNSSIASLMLDDGMANTTMADGSWWELRWEDAGIEGLLSYGDFFTVRTNSSATFDIRMFDHWAQSWTDHGE